MYISAAETKIDRYHDQQTMNKIYCKILATSSVQCHDIRGPFAYDNLAWCININKDYVNLRTTKIKINKY